MRGYQHLRQKKLDNYLKNLDNRKALNVDDNWKDEENTAKEKELELQTNLLVKIVGAEPGAKKVKSQKPLRKKDDERFIKGIDAGCFYS